MLATLLSWFAGGFRSEFGGYADEASHYITALMIRDYIAGGFPGPPLRFAENYYLHYPKVALGHWPPVFHSLEAIWMLLFGESRASMLVLISLLSGAVAFLLYRIVKRYFGVFYGVWAALLYLLLTPVQFGNTNVMTEPALSLFGMLAILTFARFLEFGSWSAAILFSLWTSLAILTKGDGLSFLLVAPLALFFTRRLDRLGSIRLWTAMFLVVVACAPYTLWTLKMVQQGWAGQFGWAYSSQAIPAMAAWMVATFGIPLAALAIMGAAGSIRRARLPIFGCIAAYALGILIFQACVPSGVEVRKLIMSFPAILFLAAAGAHEVAALLRRRLRPAYTAATLLLAGTAAWAAGNFTLVQRSEHGYRDVARFILADPAFQNAVILVSSNEPSFGEGMLITEIASRERRPGHFILRATKMIAHSDWSGVQQYRLLFHNPDELLQGLDNIPVSVVVVDYPPTPESPPHHRLLLDAIQNTDRWKLVYSRTDPAAVGGVQKIGVFQARDIMARKGLKVKVDMTETLGRSLEVSQPPANSK